MRAIEHTATHMHRVARTQAGLDTNIALILTQVTQAHRDAPTSGALVPYPRLPLHRLPQCPTRTLSRDSDPNTSPRSPSAAPVAPGGQLASSPSRCHITHPHDGLPAHAFGGGLS